jgi:hypothetical protein
MSGGSKTQTSTQQTIIPDEVKPLLSSYLQQAQTLSQQPGSNAMMDFAANDAYQQSRAAYGGIDAAKQGLMDTASGQGYYNNRFFDQTVYDAMRDITRNYQEAIAPQTNANFARAGAFGGSAWGQANERNQRGLGEALGRTTNAMRSGNYQAERANQMSAYGLLPSVSQAGMGVAQNLYGMGQNVQGQAANQLGILGNAVNVGMGGAGQSSTAPNPNYRSPLQTAIGLGALFL